MTKGEGECCATHDEVNEQKPNLVPNPLPKTVMPGLDPGIQTACAVLTAWIAGSGPAMTRLVC